MSNIGSMIAASADLGLSYAERLSTGITPEMFGRFASFDGNIIESNHPAFIFGHLSLYSSRVIEQLGGDASAHRPTEHYVELFSKDAKCVDDPNGSIYPAMDEVMEFFMAGYRAASDALKAAADSFFYDENPNEVMRAKFPTQGAMLGFYVGGHFMMHMGQLSAWRRASGMGAA